MAKKKNNSLIVKNGLVSDALGERKNRLEISPSLEKAMFNAYLNGDTYKKISEDFTKSGYTISPHRVSKIAKFYGWEIKKNEIDNDVSMQLGDDIERTRFNVVKTQNMMLNAISEDIVKDYYDYQADLADYEKGILIDKPKKPEWMNSKNWTFLQELWFKAQHRGADKMEIDSKQTMVNMDISQEQVSDMLKIMAQNKAPTVKDDIIDVSSDDERDKNEED